MCIKSSKTWTYYTIIENTVTSWNFILLIEPEQLGNIVWLLQSESKGPSVMLIINDAPLHLV